MGGRPCEVPPPATRTALGTVAGLAIAALDLGLIGGRLTAIRSLEQAPQWVDHAAFGATVGLVLRARRLRRK
jgi:hypothetical protein